MRTQVDVREPTRDAYAHAVRFNRRVLRARIVDGIVANAPWIRSSAFRNLVQSIELSSSFFFSHDTPRDFFPPAGLYLAAESAADSGMLGDSSDPSSLERVASNFAM